MIVSTILFLLTRRRIVLKPSRDRINAAFVTSDHQRAKAVWVDGRDTGVRIPAWERGFASVREYSNRKGDLGGEFGEEYRGAMNGTYHHIFRKLRGGRFVMLPEARGGDNPTVVGFDGNGRLLTVDDPPMTNLGQIRHAFLLSGTVWIDVGPADRAHFEQDRTVVGAFACDRQGRPLVPIDYGGEGFIVRFRWVNGKRTESRPYQA